MAPINFTEEQLRSLHSIPTYDYMMASQEAAATANSTQETTPVTTSTDASSQVDYFGQSSQSSTTTSSRTSVELQLPSVTSAPQKSKAKNPLPPLSREFPKPTDKIDVEEALARKPGRWSIKGSLAAGNARVAPVIDEEKEKAKRKQALEDAKKSLFAASESLKSTPLPPRTNNF
ncbi:uncharacterized protein CTRU02_212811 [Colletotrichum truncatum]|uniref:Uncharacterized protein n=1 Tax=Colletotrichum truncatum TaxID=5467 RepID=A0ACC3YJ10_COLTU|nr:uncharacterized protein CTRU02_03132 [Colletotrichum truncatum]KAF6797100.1 hypothetical protein CTRU02_03132 [Colletotrichum truncatum]